MRMRVISIIIIQTRGYNLSSVASCNTVDLPCMEETQNFDDWLLESGADTELIHVLKASGFSFKLSLIVMPHSLLTSQIVV